MPIASVELTDKELIQALWRLVICRCPQLAVGLEYEVRLTKTDTGIRLDVTGEQR